MVLEMQWPARALGRGLVGVLALTAAGGVAAETRLARIGLLTPIPSEFSNLSTTVWLRALGYREGDNVVLVRRFATGGGAQMAAAVADLTRLEVDVIVAAGTAAARAARAATATIPIVMVTDDDPVAAGLVESLERPGGNVTGVTAALPEAAARRLALLRDAVPGLERVGVLWNPDGADAPRERQDVERGGRALGLALVPLAVRARGECEAAVDAAVRERVGGLLVLADPVFFACARGLGERAVAARLPTMYPTAWFLDSRERGGLLAFGPSSFDLARHAARYVDEVLRGARPAALPARRLPRWEFVVDLRTARALGHTVPGSVLIRADRVLQ